MKLTMKIKHALSGLIPRRLSVHFYLLLAGLLGMLPGRVANAADLAVVNFNFETEGAFTCCAATPVGWTYLAGGGGFWGVFSAGTSTNFYSSAGTQSGPYAAYFRNTQDQQIRQVLSATLQPNNRYTLTIGVGRRLTVNAGTYFIQLLAGGVPLATATGTAATAGTFSDVAVVYTSGAAHAQLGQALEIRIGNVGGGDHAVDFDNVRLSSAPVEILPAANGGVALTRSGIALNRATNLWVQTDTLTNATAAAIAGPIYLALDSLSATATLTNGTGVTTRVAPLGSPYVQVLGAGGSLAPGASASTILLFSNPTRAGILYSGRILSGGNVAP